MSHGLGHRCWTACSQCLSASTRAHHISAEKDGLSVEIAHWKLAGVVRLRDQFIWLLLVVMAGAGEVLKSIKAWQAWRISEADREELLHPFDHHSQRLLLQPV